MDTKDASARVYQGEYCANVLRRSVGKSESACETLALKTEGDGAERFVAIWDIQGATSILDVHAGGQLEGS